MLLPIYQEIELLNAEESELDNIFQGKFYGNCPLVFDITKFGTGQTKIIRNFEVYLNKHNLSSKFPYALYFISDIENYRGTLNIMASKNHLPRFFNQRNKKPSGKESQILNKVHLKREKIKSVANAQSEYKLKQFAKYHKILFRESFEGHFLESILKELRNNP